MSQVYTHQSFLKGGTSTIPSLQAQVKWLDWGNSASSRTIAAAIIIIRLDFIIKSLCRVCEWHSTFTDTENSMRINCRKSLLAADHTVGSVGAQSPGSSNPASSPTTSLLSKPPASFRPLLCLPWTLIRASSLASGFPLLLRSNSALHPCQIQWTQNSSVLALASAKPTSVSSRGLPRQATASFASFAWWCSFTRYIFVERRLWAKYCDRLWKSKVERS